MPIQPPIRIPFATSGLVGLVLSHPEFAKKGYLWGIDGYTYYCFLNPNKISLEVWKKRLIRMAFILWGILALIITIISANPLFGLLTFFETSIVPLLIFRHYKRTAESFAAAAVSNGPMMELPGNMSFGKVEKYTAFLVLTPTVIGTAIGVWLGTVTLPIIGTIAGWVWGTLAGIITGANFLAIFLFILGLLAKPFNSVYGTGFSEVVTPGNGNTAHFGRSGTGFGAYFIRLGNPPATAPVCGGLTPIIVAGAAASTVTSGSIAQIYADLVASPRPLVVWSLLPLNELTDPWINEALASQSYNYQGTEPREGLVLVVGTTAWSAAHTTALIRHGVIDAAATDGSQSALLGSSGDIRIDGDRGFVATISRLASYRDPIQRYGLMMVPD